MLKTRISARIYHNFLQIWQKVLEFFAESRTCFQFLVGAGPPQPPPNRRPCLPVWLNQVANISFRSSNPQWEDAMKKFILEIVHYVTPYLAKNGGPIILAQIENEYGGNDQAYVDWCGDLVTHELAFTQIPWTMCNGKSANSTIETCNSCNCLDSGWIDNHKKNPSR